MSKSKTVIVISKELNDKQAEALREILNSPTFLELMKSAYKNRLEDVFDNDSKVESIDFEVIN